MTTLSFISGSFAIAGALLFIWLEHRYPYNKNQSTFREGFFVDLIGYGLIQSYVLGLFISWYLYKLGPLPFGVSAWPMAGQVVFFLITHDLVTYAIHRLQHTFPALWYTHEAHHAGSSVDWLSGIRSHSVEILLYETAKFLPVILLGASPEVPLYRAMIDSTYGMFIHANLDVRLGRIGLILNGPEYHRWHHSKGPEAVLNVNFGTKFSVWDRLLGTLYEPNGKKAQEYGIDDRNYPTGYFSQQIFFLKRLLLKGT